MNANTTKRSSFRDFLIVIFKRKKQIALFFVITVCTIVGITYSMEPTYLSTARILLNIGSRNVYTLPGATGDRITNNRTSDVKTEIEFLKSRGLAEKVLNSLGPETIYPSDKSNDGQSRSIKKIIFQNAAVASIKNAISQNPVFDNVKKEIDRPARSADRLYKLRSNLWVRGITNTNIIEIGFKHNNPEMAATVVNTYMDIYLDERIQLHKNTQSRTFLKDQSLELKNRLEDAEKKLELFKNENNITVLEAQQRLLLQQIADLRVSLNNTLSQETETESRITLLTEQLSQTPETIPQDEVSDNNRILIGQLEAKLVELQIEEKELLSKYTPQSRMVTNVRERISIVENKINEQENKIYQRSSVGVNVTYQRLKEELLKNQATLETLRVKKEMLIRQLAEYQTEIETLNRMETRLNRLKQSVDLYRGNFELYQAKMEASRIEEAMDNEKINDVISMNRALAPLNPISPKYRLNILLSILIGGIGGLLIAIIGDYMDSRLETPEDVEGVLQLTNLTSIADAAGRKKLDHRKVETVQSSLRIELP